jgi:hypothetical protein
MLRVGLRTIYRHLAAGLFLRFLLLILAGCEGFIV